MTSYSANLLKIDGGAIKSIRVIHSTNDDFENYRANSEIARALANAKDAFPPPSNAPDHDLPIADMTAIRRKFEAITAYCKSSALRARANIARSRYREDTLTSYAAQMDEEADRFSRLLETLDFSETYFLDVHATFYD